MKRDRERRESLLVRLNQGEERTAEGEEREFVSSPDLLLPVLLSLRMLPGERRSQ